ncbi:hypothetical protein SDC9_211750 [bioreactor metagenome]|uniref:Uncharacterized protein n=1 Tax=bioreactor metagenome TaxID=1076179 RepID=A0A645JK66_9ZZZZ
MGQFKTAGHQRSGAAHGKAVEKQRSRRVRFIDEIYPIAHIEALLDAEADVFSLAFAVRAMVD